MADHFQTGVRPGDLLVSHPYWSNTQRVCFVTEHTGYSTVALQINTPAELTVGQLDFADNSTVSLDEPVYYGGDFNRNSLILLHDHTWYSSNTMPITSHWSITSDQLMLEKLEMGNLPEEYRMVLGITAWEPGEIETLLADRRSEWLLFKNPEPGLIMMDPLDTYNEVLTQLMSRTTNHYFDQ